MRKHITTIITILTFSCAAFTGCTGTDTAGNTEAAQKTEESKTEALNETVLEDGVYTADFDTDSSMFRVNETCGGKGTLTVKDGEMTIHISLLSKKIVNLYSGTAKDAQKDGAEILKPTTDTVTYEDGMTEEVFGFDVPVPMLEQEFDLALLGTKGTWYDHKVSVSNPKPKTNGTGNKNSENASSEGTVPENGVYTAELTFEGGSGKAFLESPARLSVQDGKMTATVTWSSPNYDYMLVDGEKYLPVNTTGNSVFEIPVSVLDKPLSVIGDTVAMSTPHEIEYTVTFHSDTLTPEK